MSSFKWNWDDFDPKVVQTDKRDREGAVAKGTKMVMKNLNELGLSSFVAVPVVDRNRTIENIVHVFPPNSPLEAFFMNKDNRQFVRGLDKALTDTQMWALELWDLKEVMEEDIEARKKFEEMTGMEDENDEDEAGDEAPLKKPCKPIFTMTAEEISVYFGCLLKELYKLEGIEKFKLWAKKKDNEVLAKATALKVYDTKAEEILARDEYIGRGSGGQNIGNKLKIVSAYLLQKYEIDHNTFAESVPSNYQKIRINFDDYEELVSTKNIRNKTVKSRVAKATKSKLKQQKKDQLLQKIPLMMKKRQDPKSPDQHQGLVPQYLCQDHHLLCQDQHQGPVPQFGLLHMVYLAFLEEKIEKSHQAHHLKKTQKIRKMMRRILLYIKTLI